MSGLPDPDAVGELRALQRDVPPARDLWPAIEATIRNGDVPQVQPVAARWRPARWAVGLVAGVALFANGIWIGRAWLAPPADPAAQHAAAAPTLLTAANFTPGAAYQAARAAQLAQLPARLAALPQPARDQVQASLDTLQRSLAEISAALGEEPANALLQSLLIDTYQEEMRVLTTLNTATLAREEI